MADAHQNCNVLMFYLTEKIEKILVILKDDENVNEVRSARHNQERPPKILLISNSVERQ